MGFLPFLWLALIIAAIVIEGMSAQLVSIWFVAGGVAALIASLCGASFAVQMVLYVLVTAAALAATRPFVKKAMTFKKEDTNAGRYLGKIGIVTSEINNTAAVGQVKVLGNIWSARSSDGSIIPAGASVLVLRIEGVKLIVELQS